MRWAPAWAAATACVNPNTSVMFVLYPYASSFLAAWMPAHVPGSLMSTRDVSTPRSLYIASIRHA